MATSGSQGSKGKSSSQSDKNYWSRIKLAGGSSKRKTKSRAKAKGQVSPVFPHVIKPAPLLSAVFSGIVSENFPKWAENGYYPHFVIADGKTIDIRAKLSEALQTLSDKRPGSFGKIMKISPLGAEVLASSLR